MSGWDWPKLGGKYIDPADMTPDQRDCVADRCAQANSDGGPSPGADFLMAMRDLFGREVIRELIDEGEDVWSVEATKEGPRQARQKGPQDGKV